MLKVSGLTKVYGRGRLAVRALDNISIDFPDRGLVVILGKSGCGKSTLMNMLGGLDRPTKGDILIDGRRLSSFSAGKLNDYRNTYIGFVFQNFNIIENRTVYENIELALKLQNNESDVTFIDDVLMNVGLGGLGYRKPSELSGGQRQRVAIARALVKNPEIILADEPTGAVDSHTGDDLFVLLKKLSKTKLVIVVTHDSEVAYRYGDRIISLEDGRIAGDVDRKKRLDDAETRKLRDNILFVKAGHTFTRDDVSRLVDARRDNYLTFEQDKQHVILAYPDVIDKVDTGYTAGDFAPHEPPPETPERRTKLRRARMGLGNCIREALANLKKRRRKVATMTVVATGCMIFFYIAVAFVTVKPGRVFRDSALEYGVDFMSAGTIEGRYASFDADAALDAVSGFSAGLRYRMILNHYPADSATTSPAAFEDRIEGFITVKNLEDYGLSLDCGELPDAPGEILVSDYFADALVSTGYIRCEDGALSLYRPTSRAGLAGTGLYVSYGGNYAPLVISGVYKTNAEAIGIMSEDGAEYDSYFNMSAQSYYLFVIGGESLRDYVVDELCRIPLSETAVFGGEYISGPRFAEYSPVSKDEIVVSVKGFNPKAALADGDVVISAELAGVMYYATAGYTDTVTPAMMRSVLREFGYNPAYMYYYAEQESALTLNVVAVVYGQGDNEIRANAHTLNAVARAGCVPSELVLTTAQKDLSALSDAAAQGGLYLENALFGSAVSGFVSELAGTTDTLFAVAGVLAFFVLITILNFLIVMTKERRKENGIMRALGASSAETIRVFNIELSFIVALVVSVSAAVSALVLRAVNSSLFAFVQQPVVLVRLGLTEFAAGFVAFAAFVFICSAPILLRQARRQPIDVINDI